MATLLSYALSTVADVKESLGIDSGDHTKDNLIIRKINQATMYIESYCNLPIDHHFVQTTYTNEEYDGAGSNQMSLFMRPVISVSSFQVRNTTQNQSDWDTIDTSLYFVDLNSGVIDLLFSESRNWNIYRVTYIAGFATIPIDLAEACASLAAFYVSNGGQGTAVKRKQEGQREIEYFPPSGSGVSNNALDQLGLDDVLSRYINYALTDNK